jgi:ATP-dependent protease Clp ATPase subunit
VDSLLCRLLQETNGEIDASQRGIVYSDEIVKLRAP